jgi:hypothetical protein
MADRVIRHFERMRAPRAKRVAIQWPEGARDLAPVTFGAVFEGDTVSASAQFNRPAITGHVTLEIETDGGEVFRQQLAMTPPQESAERTSTVARLAASARLKETDRVPGLEQALRYRLVSPWTNWLVVAARPDGEKALDIPVIRKVPQTLAAGWGGVGVVVAGKGADMRLLSARLSLRRDASAAKVPDLEPYLREGLSETMPDLSDLLLQADDVNREVDYLAKNARRTVESLQEHGQMAERELRAIENQVGALRSAIDTIQSTADVLRRKIGEMEDRTNHWLRATEELVETGVLEPQEQEAIQQLLMRRDECQQLLIQLEELLAHLQERSMLLGHLQEVAREWTEVIMRYRHLVRK